MRDIKVKIGDRELVLCFNNFAHVELSRLLFKVGETNIGPSDVLDRLQEVAGSNVLLLMKYLIYAGVVGYDYREGFETNYTQKQIGELLQNANSESLFGIWDAFLEEMGAGLIPPFEHDESETSEAVEKKS